MRKLILSAAVLLLLVAAVRLFTTMFSTTPARAEDVPFDDTLRRIRIPTVMYHYISVPPENSDIYRIDLSVNPENFRQQMQWLKMNNFNTISMDQFVGALKRGDELPTNPVLLTFDDGYLDAYTQAFPILKEYGFVGTFFVVTDWIDQHRRGYLTWNQVKEMADAGMSIHSHSRDHLDVRDRDDAWFAYQIAATYDTLDAHLGKQLRVFCYPSGRLDDETVERLARIGVVAAFTTQDGTINTSDTSMLRLPRVRMRNTTSVQDFAHLLRWVR